MFSLNLDKSTYLLLKNKMKKTLSIFMLIGALVVFPSLISAQGVQQQNKVQDSTTQISVSPTGNQVQNQVQTQNQGEGIQLMVATQQMQRLMDMEGLNEEVGNKVRTLAQEQVQAQTQIQTQLNKLETKSNFMKKLFGPDFGAIKNLNQQMEQNKLRIQQLQQLQNQVSNQADKTQLQEAIQTLLNQNTSLQEQIRAEEKVGSLFGWFVKLFYR
ncbi:MAG: hypothetical protein US62_C0053G0001 [Candidatus Woesebacteria bacterium GW2011_GWA1_37_8]|uniref:Uncharacterized protein n=1 Tax=Candidatus Woesebacteria bacterium GW2011_GWA1_37_8 TaxID=1618546 RepID=A0A0G0HX63_9BACT|nr:MAG: hypothetical protein US62_C0053G0001 [Candidatus Woesebacteria bacterium GW2011_GWA1_37_8]